jgi:hypothetical protein
MIKSIHYHEKITAINAVTKENNHHVLTILQKTKRQITCACCVSGESITLAHIDSKIVLPDVGGKILIQTKLLSQNNSVCRIKDFVDNEELKTNKTPWETGQTYIPKIEKSIEVTVLN